MHIRVISDNIYPPQTVSISAPNGSYHAYYLFHSRDNIVGCGRPGDAFPTRRSSLDGLTICATSGEDNSKGKDY